MVVAVPGVRVVQVPVDQVVDVVAMRDGRMAAVRPMHVGRLVAATGMRGGAARRVGVGHRNHVLLDRRARLMMQVPVMEVIDMSVVMNGDVAAIGAVGMGVVRVQGHRDVPVEGGRAEA